VLASAGFFDVVTSFSYRMHLDQRTLGGFAHPIDAPVRVLGFYRNADDAP
jgi:hypothetical protein